MENPENYIFIDVRGEDAIVQCHCAFFIDNFKDAGNLDTFKGLSQVSIEVSNYFEFYMPAIGYLYYTGGPFIRRRGQPKESQSCYLGRNAHGKPSIKLIPETRILIKSYRVRPAQIDRLISAHLWARPGTPRFVPQEAMERSAPPVSYLRDEMHSGTC